MTRFTFAPNVLVRLEGVVYTMVEALLHDGQPAWLLRRSTDGLAVIRAATELRKLYDNRVLTSAAESGSAARPTSPLKEISSSAKERCQKQRRFLKEVER